MFVIRFRDGTNVQSSTPSGALALLRRGGCRLVSGDAGALRRLDAEERERLEAALKASAEASR